MSRQSKISLSIGGIAFFATIAIYGIIRPTVFPSTTLGLCFLLYSEAVLFGGFTLIDRWSEKSSTLLTWSGIGVPVGIYGIVVFLSSLMFMGAHTAVVKGFLTLQIILLVAILTICLIIGSFSLRIRSEEGKIHEAGRTIQYAIDQLTQIKEQTDRKEDVDKLIEGLRFSDTSVTVDLDKKLSGAITTLRGLTASEDASKDEFSKAAQEIGILIKERSLQAKALKQGGI